MLGTPLVADLIFKGAVHQIKEVMAKSTAQGMCTFDQYLFELYEQDQISYEEALRNADSKRAAPQDQARKRQGHPSR